MRFSANSCICSRRKLRLMSLPLFDEFAVTEAEVQLWLDNVPNLSASTFRREAYRKAYNIEGKIRAFKHDGAWPEYLNKFQSNS